MDQSYTNSQLQVNISWFQPKQFLISFLGNNRAMPQVKINRMPGGGGGNV